MLFYLVYQLFGKKKPSFCAQTTVMPSYVMLGNLHVGLSMFFSAAAKGSLMVISII